MWALGKLITILLRWGETTQPFELTPHKSLLLVKCIQMPLSAKHWISVNTAGNWVYGDWQVLTSSRRGSDASVRRQAVRVSTLTVFMSMLSHRHQHSSECWLLMVHFRCQMCAVLISKWSTKTHTHTQNKKSQTSICIWFFSNESSKYVD